MNVVFPIFYFGNISYFKELATQHRVILDIKEHFIKQTYRNRCRILGANGILDLTVPVIKPQGSKTVYEDVQISYATDWQRQHWKAIESAYRSAPFFDHYGIEVKELILKSPSHLVELNTSILERVNNWLDLNIQHEFSQEYVTIELKNDRRLKDFDEANVAFYQQVFTDKLTFVPNLSILDLIFSEGPLARKWIIN